MELWTSLLRCLCTQIRRGQDFFWAIHQTLENLVQDTKDYRHAAGVQTMIQTELLLVPVCGYWSCAIIGPKYAYPRE